MSKTNVKIGKPKNEICDKCFVKNNSLRCMTCKHKTEEWMAKCRAIHPIMLLGECDNFKEKEV